MGIIHDVLDITGNLIICTSRYWSDTDRTQGFQSLPSNLSSKYKHNVCCFALMLHIELNYRAFILESCDLGSQQQLSQSFKPIFKQHMWKVIKQILCHLMKNIDNTIVIADKPGKINTMFSNFTLHCTLFIKSSAHNVQHTNNKKYIVEVFEEASLMTRNNSEVAPEQVFRTGTALVLLNPVSLSPCVSSSCTGPSVLKSLAIT